MPILFVAATRVCVDEYDTKKIDKIIPCFMSAILSARIKEKRLFSENIL